MKEAFWGVGLIILSVFGIFLISLFGNITVTNQQDYTALKNTVEAAMYDAIDMGRFRSGFCVCTKEAKGSNGKWTFTSSSQYEINDLENDVCVPNEGYECEKIIGEYIIDKKVFAESLVRRFAESVKGNYDYKVVIDDVIEYPPKVSVDIKSKNTYELDENDEYSISNHIDAILEMDVNKLTCLPENIICYTETKQCLDAITGDHCGEIEDTGGSDPEPDTCIPPFTQKSKGDYVCSYDQYGNECGCFKITIPKPNTTPNIKALGEKVEIHKGGCFLPGTKIAVKNGYKDIDKLLVGEYVLTYNEEKQINEYKKIVNVFELKDLDEELYTIKTDDTEMSLTGHHRVYTKRNNQYEFIAAQDLKLGDIVKYANGEYHKIIEIDHNAIKKTVYNLEIEDNHNFYVGDKKILVHNAVAGGLTSESMLK